MQQHPRAGDQPNSGALYPHRNRASRMSQSPSLLRPHPTGLLRTTKQLTDLRHCVPHPDHDAKEAIPQ
eukprot:831853-Prymnesium_polylepis.1